MRSVASSFSFKNELSSQEKKSCICQRIPEGSEVVVLGGAIVEEKISQEEVSARADL